MKATDCPIALGTIITDDYLDIMASQLREDDRGERQEARVGYQHYRQVALQDFLDGLLELFRSGQSARRSYSLPPVDPRSTRRARPARTDLHHLLRRVAAPERERLRNEIVLVLGESTSLYVSATCSACRRDSFVAQAAWGSLGTKRLRARRGPGQRQAALRGAGDGGFRMICQELSSLVRQKCNAVVFVMSNKGYAIEQAFVDIAAFTPAG